MPPRTFTTYMCVILDASGNALFAFLPRLKPFHTFYAIKQSMIADTEAMTHSNSTSPNYKIRFGAQ